MANRFLLLLSLLSLLAIHYSCSVALAEGSSEVDDDLLQVDDDDLLEEDLSFLQDGDEVPNPNGNDSDEHSDGDDADQEDFPTVDEKDVVVLRNKNFSRFVKKNKYLMVEFYAPWCGHCRALAPEYAAAATELKEEVPLAKVDVTVENKLAQKYQVEGLPTLLFFIDGVHRPYIREMKKEAIVTWIKKKIGPGVQNVSTTEDAERILDTEDRLAVCFLDSLVGPESNILAAAAKLDDDVNFYQTAIPEVAKFFHIDPNVKRPALILLKKEAEKISHFNGQFTKSAITEFVNVNKLPLVTTFSKESAPLLFGSPITKQILFFATSHGSREVMPTMVDAAKFFKGKLVFVYVEMDNEEVGRPVSGYFGVSGDGPTVMAYTGNRDGKKYIFDGEVTLDRLKEFGKKFLEGKLTPFFKSDPVPESNNEDVKVVVGNNFEEIVLDNSKDVFLDIYAPWCGHCQELEPTFNKLAKHLRGIDSIVIAKMDGTTNEHPGIKIVGFPTLLFFPAGAKKYEPISFEETEHTVVGYYKFLRKHASIPFKLEKPSSPEKVDASNHKHRSTNNLKDEL